MVKNLGLGSKNAAAFMLGVIVKGVVGGDADISTIIGPSQIPPYNQLSRKFVKIKIMFLFLLHHHLSRILLLVLLVLLLALPLLLALALVLVIAILFRIKPTRT